MSTREAWILKKPDAVLFFATLAKEMRLIAPKKLFDGDERLEVLDSPMEIHWDYGHDLYPPGKRFIFPHYEDMFRYRNSEIQPCDDAPKQAIVGIRSCDVSAVRFQERFFGGPEIVDPFYKARLDNTVLFSLACNKPPKKECFCICCNAGPWLDSGYDVQLTDLGDRFLYEVGSDKGQKATEGGSYILGKADDTDFDAQSRLHLQADSLFETKAYVAKSINYISADDVPPDVWETLGSTCHRCGACTNLCPICTCYTVDDLKLDDGCFVRCRSWDSCQYSGFTREASGHNPRPTFGTRIQRRFYHKNTYQYITRDTTHGCAGCGRCISACLTDLGVPTVVKRLRRMMHDYLEPQDQKAEV